MIPNKVNGDFVSYVLDTYDLSEEQREKLARTSLFRLRDDGITNFDEAYTYIDTLAMRAQSRHRARMRSLDEEIGETKRTLYEIIGTEDNNVKRLFEDVQSREKLSGQEVVECLSYALDRQDTEILSKLMEGQRVEFDVSLDYLLDNAEEIGGRIRQIAQRYEKDGIVLLPRRPIVQVTWDPFNVEFENHQGRRLTEEEINNILVEFKRVGNVESTARHLGYAGTTVARYLRKRGMGDLIRTHRNNGPVTDEERIAIIQAYKLFQGNSRAAERHLCRGYQTILRYWREEGLETRGVGSKLTLSEREHLISLYQKFNGNVSKASKDEKYSPVTVLKYWREAGLIQA